MSSHEQGSPNSSTSIASATQEYIVRVPKSDKKKYNVMKFNSSLNVDFAKWSQVKLERENNAKDIKHEEEMPKFGAGSEYGRELREEARKKKYGASAKKYNAEDQPWLLRIGGKAGRKLRGIKEGGVTENASYYVFTQAPDGAFEAFPINDWYNFTPVQTYKTLNAEEAEEEFGRRDKVFNYFSIMLKKRLKTDEDAAEGGGEREDAKKSNTKKKYKGSGDLKITDMEDWVNSSADDEDDDDEEGGKGDDQEKKAKSKGTKKGQQQKKGTKKKKKKGDESDSEAWEDSDDGDDEGREVDYISDESSDSEDEPEVKAKDDLKGVEDEEAIRKMEQSESDEEGEEGDGTKENGEEGKDETANAGKADKAASKDNKKEKKDGGGGGGSSSDTSEDTSDSDDFDNDSTFQSAMFMPSSSNKKTPKKGKKDNSGNHNSTPASRSNTPTKLLDKTSGGAKRSLEVDGKEQQVATKRSRIEMPTTSSQSFEGISEEAIRRYLMRKPMTASELLQKFKSKKTGLSSDQMVNTITQILKRLNPDKQMVKGKMYLSIKPS